MNKVREILQENTYDLNMNNMWGDYVPLHLACEKGRLAVVRALVSEFQADVALQDEGGCTPLHHACREGRLAVVRALIGVGV